VSGATSGELAAEEKLLNEPLYQALRPKAVEFITRLRAATTTEEWVLLHQDLLVEFGARQDAAHEVIPAAKGEVAQEIARLAKMQPKPTQELREKQALLDRIKQQEVTIPACQHTLRQIADGIAWRALGYERRLFDILGEGDRVGRLASGVGREAELAELQRLWDEEKVFAIHNDLTNCLRHGDLTAIRPGRSALEINLLEIKAGRCPGDTPQLRRMGRAIALLREGRQIRDGEMVRVTVVPAPYETYLGLLSELISTARQAGYAWVRPHECLLVGAVDYRIWGRCPESFSRESEAEKRRLNWTSEKSNTLAWTASQRRIRDRKWSFSSLAPYTVFPLSAEDVADVVMGFVDVFCALDITLLERALTRDGLSVRVARPGPAQSLFLDAQRGRVGLRLPPHLREQMQIELMTPDALRKAIDHVLDINLSNPSQIKDRRIVVFADEAETWK
jgi:hypothetical protein